MNADVEVTTPAILIDKAANLKNFDMTNLLKSRSQFSGYTFSAFSRMRPCFHDTLAESFLMAHEI